MHILLSYNLGKHESNLKRLGFPHKKVADHINDIRKQRITNVFFLPGINSILDDSIIQFDRICSCSNDSISRADLKNKRIFTLSNYGFYLFLFKLSLHFTRIQEKVQRN